MSNDAYQINLKQIKIVSIFILFFAIVLLLISLFQIRLANKVRTNSNYTWCDVVELTDMKDTGRTFPWPVFFIEVTVRKAIASLILSFCAFTIFIILQKFKKSSIFYLDRIKELESKIGKT